MLRHFISNLAHKIFQSIDIETEINNVDYSFACGLDQIFEHENEWPKLILQLKLSTITFTLDMFLLFSTVIFYAVSN